MTRLLHFNPQVAPSRSCRHVHGSWMQPAGTWLRRSRTASGGCWWDSRARSTSSHEALKPHKANALPHKIANGHPFIRSLAALANAAEATREVRGLTASHKLHKMIPPSGCQGLSRPLCVCMMLPRGFLSRANRIHDLSLILAREVRMRASLYAQ